MDAHFKNPLYSTSPGMIYRNMGYSDVKLGDYKHALEANSNCFKLVST